MKFDDLLTLLGDFGKFQRTAYILVCLPIVFVSMHYMAPVFILATPSHRCAIPGMVNDTYRIHGNRHLELVQRYIPTRADNVTYSACSIYTHGRTNTTAGIQVEACSRWVYDYSIFTDSITTEMDFVCSRSLFRAHATMVYSLGSMIGCLVIGHVSDRFGRKLAYMVELILMMCASLLQLWLSNVYVLLTIRFLLGFSCGVLYNTAFVYAMEFVGPSKRTLCGLLINQFWAAGLLLQTGLAYFLRSWRSLHLAMSLPILVFLPYIWLLPNSVRWLFTKGRIDECLGIIKKMIHTNKVAVNINELDMQIADTCGNGNDVKDDNVSDNILELLFIKQRTLLLRLLVVLFNWFVVNLMYFGLTLNVTNLGGDVYVNFAFSAAMEAVAYTLCIPAVFRLGRKKFHCGCMLSGGVALIATIFIKNSPWLVIALSLAGKLVASAAYATIYLYSLELFPTVVRHTAMGMGSCSSGIGGILAPYIVEMGQLLNGTFAEVVPLLVFGTASLAAGLSSLILPETAGAKLPDTFADITIHVKPNKNSVST